MEEQNSQPSKNFENFNQNSTGLRPGKVDEADQNCNGILSYGDHTENEGVDVANVLRPEKQVSETSSTTNMTSSSSQDTGFGSASASEISSPVENNDLTDKSLQESTASKVEGEEDDSRLDDTISEHDENKLNNKERYENVTKAEEEQSEEVPNDKTEDQIVENVANRDTFVDHIEEAVSDEGKVEIFESDVNDNAEPDNVEHAALEDRVVKAANTVDDTADDDNNTVEQTTDDNFREREEYESSVKTPDKNAVNSLNYSTVDENVQIKSHKESENKAADNDEKESDNIENTYKKVSNEYLENSVNITAGSHSVFETKQNQIDNDSVTSPPHEPTADESVEETTEGGNVRASTNYEVEYRKETGQNNDKAKTDEELEKCQEELNKDKEDNVAVNKTNDERCETPTKKQTSDDGEENESTKNENVKRAEDEETASDTMKDEDTKKANVDMVVEEEEKNVMDILGNGLLKKKVLVPGRGAHTRPNSGDIVTVRVDGQLPDGTHVDTGEITFTLNDGDVILAFELAVALMEEGETCGLFTSERYAYGSLGREPDIPKDSSITYTLELLGVQKPPDVSEISFDQRLKMGEAKRERGNYLFGRTDYSGAINSYNKAVKLLDNPELNEGIDEGSTTILRESWVKCYNNLAACQLKIDALDAAIKSCEKVLSAQEDNIKALFRLGKAYGAKGDVDQAITYVRRALRLDPESKLMQQEMLHLTRRKNKETATERALYQRMLGVKPEEKCSLTDEDKKRSNANKLVKWTLVAGGIATVLISVGLTWYRAS